MRIGLVIVGDELLSGKRSDRHLPAVIELLAGRGLALDWARMLGDDLALLTAAYRETRASGDLVLSAGGIGATPDDLTRQAAAQAFEVSLAQHPEGAALLRAKWGEETTPQRLRMVEFPQGARLIPNPVNQVPGFSIEHHHFVPGFPTMAWPMFEWVLDTLYADLRGRGEQREYSQIVRAPESKLVPAIETVLARHPDIKLASLPSTARMGEVELAVIGPPAQAAAADALLRQLLDAAGIERLSVGGDDTGGH